MFGLGFRIRVGFRVSVSLRLGVTISVRVMIRFRVVVRAGLRLGSERGLGFRFRLCWVRCEALV